MNEALVGCREEEILRSSRYSTELSLMLVSFCEPDRNGWLATLRDRKRSGPYFEGCILGCIRGMDRPFPYNADQMAVLLPNTNAAGAQVLAKKMLDSFAGPAGPGEEGKGSGLSLNIGMAVFPIDEVSRDGLIRCAEAALNMAMRKGSNQLVLASSLARQEGGIQRDVTAWIESVREMGQSSIYNLLAVVDATEHYIVPHSQNTTRLSIAIAQVLGLHAANIRKLRVTSLLHDLGKIYLATDVITRPGPLDDKELVIMKKHPEFGATVVQQFPDFAFCSKAILAHHERMDGSGYPAGLKGEHIPLESRIISVAEAFDDMVTQRPYRENVSLKDAVKELTKNSGTQFDPEIVNALKKVISGASRR
jgi:HD-GYP domain-containing protein (c-di-GMP phosphodiesterase class II)